MKKTTVVFLLWPFVLAAQPAMQGGENNAADTVYSVVDVPARFPGGMKRLFSYLNSVKVYPADMLEQKKEGKVYVKFVIDREGKVTQPKVIKSLCPSADKEALRIIKQMPRWEPARQGGEPVASYYTLPVTFAIKSP